MTHDLVERLVGHRTRLAQEPAARWHDGEDQALERHLEASGKLDRVGTRFVALVPRGWLVVGVAALGPAFVAGHASATQLAVSLGGVLLAYRALHRLGQGLHSLAGAAIAWRQVSGLWNAAERVAPPSMPMFALARRPASPGQMLIEAHDLVFRYRDRGEAVLRGCSVRIAHGQRLLVEGPSGGGKSTLAAIFAGLRAPESGLLLLGGLDRHTLGLDGWRSRVVSAPQFHENHVLVGTFAFNLLLGRAWPASQADLDEAEAVCRELDLGGLLSRMPAGLMQMVGETGWQLSHGERSRLYIARALLQKSELILLDESFAALDPETMRTALKCVLTRAPTLLVVAHP
jgi:ATP-binding cassette subfamily B protein